MKKSNIVVIVLILILAIILGGIVYYYFNSNMSKQGQMGELPDNKGMGGQEMVSNEEAVVDIIDETSLEQPSNYTTINLSDGNTTVEGTGASESDNIVTIRDKRKLYYYW